MNWVGLDYHSHICGAPIDAMVARAVEGGAVEYGVSEHIYMLDEGHVVFPLLEEVGERCSREQYVEAVRSRAAEEKRLSIRLGLEIDFLRGTEGAVSGVLANVDWDFLLGSIHEIDGFDLFDDVPASAAEGERLWQRYYELIAEAIESGMFDVITHPVRNAERNPHLPGNLDRLLDEVASFAKFHGVALELNGYDTLNWPELVERLARACGRTGCPISLGSDAHEPSEVGQGLRDATRMAIEAGVPAVVSMERRDKRLVRL